MKKLLLAVVTAAILVPSLAQGGLITYSFGSLTTGAPTSISGVDVTSGNMSMVNQTTGFTSPAFTAPGTVATAISGTSASSGYAVPITATGTNNIGTAVSNLAFGSTTSAYFQVVLNSTNPGDTMTLNSIGFGARSTATGATSISVRSSADNFATSLTSFTLTADSAWRGFNNTSLSAVLGSGPVTLRLYASGGGSTASASTINTRLDDIQIGVSAVPEPTSIAMFGLVATGLLIRRRR